MDLYSCELLVNRCRRPGAGVVDLWLVDAEENGFDWSECQNLLSEDELARANRFVIPSIALSYIKYRVLLRVILSKYLSVPASAVNFAYGINGKPYLLGYEHDWCHFNLSHADGLMMLAVSSQGQLGVDCERFDRQSRFLSIAKRDFTHQEYLWLASAEGVGIANKFWRLWVAKESCLKCIGEGLVAGLDSVRFIERSGKLVLCPDSRFGVASSMDDRSQHGVDHGYVEAFMPLDDIVSGYCLAMAASFIVTQVRYQHLNEKKLIETCFT